MNYYTSDLHFYHNNIIELDNRPFFTIQEMNGILIDAWNARINKNDTVYILGDFCFGKEEKWIQILNNLNGSKILIRGNHDLKQMSKTLKSKFREVTDYKEIKDNGQRIIMSHYPMPFYKSVYSPNTYHLYGHLHNTIEEKCMQKLKQVISSVSKSADKKDNSSHNSHKLQYYNCWCGFYNYAPATLTEIINRWN